MPTDILGNHFDVGDLVTIAMANAGPHNEPVLVFVVVDQVIENPDSYTPFHIKGRPLRATQWTASAVGPDARRRTYTKPENILALPGKTIGDIKERAQL